MPSSTALLATPGAALQTTWRGEYYRTVDEQLLSFVICPCGLSRMGTELVLIVQEQCR